MRRCPPRPLDLSRLDELFEVDAEAGLLMHKTRLGIASRRASRIAGRVWAGDEYLMVTLDDRNVRVHRIIWVLHHGRNTELEIDHINGDKLDNRIANLREATRSQNTMNSRKRDGTSSQFKGVFFHSRRKKWCARIGVDARQYHIGYFDQEEMARAAYAEAARRLHGEFARVA